MENKKYLSLLADDIILYIENLKESLRTSCLLTNKQVQQSWSVKEISKQKLHLFLSTCNEQWNIMKLTKEFHIQYHQKE